MKFTRESVTKHLHYDPAGPETQQVWGTGEDKNLGIALSPKGDHVWIVRIYVLQANKTTKKRIGRLFRRPLSIRDKSLDEARQERNIWMVEAASGADPIEKRRPLRAAAPTELGPATVAVLMHAYMEHHVRRELEAASWDRYSTLVKHINLHLGSVPTSELDKAKLNAFRRALCELRETFNKSRKLLTAAFKAADRLDWTWGGAPMVPPGVNPVAALLPYPKQATRPAGDPLEPEEVEALIAAAEQYFQSDSSRVGGRFVPHRSSAVLPLFLLFTGLRKNEGMGLTWKPLSLPKSSGWRGWIDRRREVIQLIHHKSSRKRGSRTVPLSPQALRVLDLMVGKDEIWVFPGSMEGERIKKPEAMWIRLQEEAGIRVRRGLHQTRHTFITRALEAGAPISAVAKAAGHATTYITETYEHISDKAARSAAELAGNEMHQ